MRIMMNDGVQYEGTPLEIVVEMQSRAFIKPGATVAEYLDFAAENGRVFFDVEMKFSGRTDAELAAAFLESAFESGLAHRVDRDRPS